MALMLYLPLWLIKYTLGKIVLALYARHANLPSDIWCAYGFVDPLDHAPPTPPPPALPMPSWVWAYPLTENLHARKSVSFLWGSGHR